MCWMIPYQRATFLGSLLVFFIYGYLFTRERKNYIGLWTLGWAGVVLRYFSELLMSQKGQTPFLLMNSQLSAFFSGLLILWGTLVFLKKAISKQLLIYACVAGTVWTVVGVLGNFSLLLLAFPTFVFFGIINIWTGLVLLRSRDFQGTGKHISGWAFVLYGLHKLDYPFLLPAAWLVSQAYLIDALLLFALAFGFLLIYFEKARRDCEYARVKCFENEERYRTLFENVNDMIFLMEMTPQGPARLVDVNESVSTLLGYNRQELLALSAQDLIFQDPSMDVKEIMRKLFEEKSVRFDSVLVSKNGLKIPIENNTSLFTWDNKKMALSVARDITECKRLEDTVRVTERRFGELLENVFLIAVLLDARGNIMFCNDFLLHVTGYTREEVLGQRWFDTFIPEDIRPTIESMFFGHIKMGDMPSHYENEIQTKQRERRLIRWNNTVLRDAQGNIVGTAGIGEDITDRKQAEMALRISEERFRTIVTSMEDIVFTLDGEQRYTGIFGRLLQEYNFSPSFFLGKTATQVFTPEGAVGHENAARRALSGEHVIYDWSLGGPQGMRYFLTSLSPIRDFNGKIVGAVGVGRDVTSRKEAEELLKRYQIFFENAADIVLFVRFDGGQIIDANNAALQIFGFTREELLSLSMNQLRAPETLKDVTEDFKQSLLKGASYETVYLRKDGRKFPAEVSARSTVIGNETIIVSIIRDISARRQSQEVLKNKMDEITKLNTFMIGREKRIIELKKEVDEVLRGAGKPPRYKA